MAERRQNGGVGRRWCGSGRAESGEVVWACDRREREREELPCICDEERSEERRVKRMLT